jgi:hypothetical protein
MIIDDDPPSRPDRRQEPSGWPLVSPGHIGVDDYEYDLAYMGVYLRLEILNRSPYLVREATLRVDGLGPGAAGTTAPGGVVTSREIKVGPLFPGVPFREELGIGAPGGITGLSFESVAAQAVRLTPPDQMVPAGEYPGLAAEILDVTVDPETPDLRGCEEMTLGETRTAEATFIRIVVRNAGKAVVDRVQLKVRYFEAGDEAAIKGAGSRRGQVAEWIFDMPHREWNPYRLAGPPDGACDPAAPLPPGRSYEFVLAHYDGGPRGWAGRLEATSVEVCAVRLQAE